MEIGPADTPLVAGAACIIDRKEERNKLPAYPTFFFHQKLAREKCQAHLQQ